jgi:1-acyl-sn-glycerol-3-phosphate acyltransferase
LIRPTREQLAPLSRMERFSFRFAEGINNTRPVKWSAQVFLHVIGASWVRVCTANLIRLHGYEKLAELRPPGGVMIVSNHRSFFDLYVIAQTLYWKTKLPKNLYFPVRADFFYQGFTGMFVNAVMAAFSMYPPMMREAEKKGFNRFSLERLKELCSEKGTVVGYHPEGTRNKTGDPYTFLPGKPGAGEIAYHARPTVIPFFINGLRVDGLAKQVTSNFDRSGTPVWVVAGEPVNLDRFYEEPPSSKVYKAISDEMLVEIGKLGEIEKRLRAGEPGAPPAQPRPGA